MTKFMVDSIVAIMIDYLRFKGKEGLLRFVL